MAKADACSCALDFVPRVGRAHEYHQLKRVLDRAYFPTFIGRQSVQMQVPNGGVTLYEYAGDTIGATVINVNLGILNVLAVVPEHQGHHLGRAILAYTRPNFARVIEQKVGWFEAHGYTSLGAMHMGRRFRTQVMVRGELMQLAGRARRLLMGSCGCCDSAKQQQTREVERRRKLDAQLQQHVEQLRT